MTDPEAIDVEAALDLRVDPVAEAEGYRHMLLGVLGDRDPAQTQADLADQLEEVVQEAGPRLRTTRHAKCFGRRLVVQREFAGRSQQQFGRSSGCCVSGRIRWNRMSAR